MKINFVKSAEVVVVCFRAENHDEMIQLKELNAGICNVYSGEFFSLRLATRICTGDLIQEMAFVVSE